MNSSIRFRFDDKETLQAWKSYKEMGKFVTMPMKYGKEHHMLMLRQIPTLSAMNFLKMLGHEGVDSYEALYLTDDECESYLNFLRTLDGV